MAAINEGEVDDCEVQRDVVLPDEGDNSRPKPVKVMLVGGEMDAQVIEAPAEATHVNYWIYKNPSAVAPPKAEWGGDKTKQVRYQLHPIVGNRQTWYIGRLCGTAFDDAVTKIMEHYHARAGVSTKR